jgi:hypothetical protein
MAKTETEKQPKVEKDDHNHDYHTARFDMERYGKFLTYLADELKRDPASVDEFWKKADKILAERFELKFDPSIAESIKEEGRQPPLATPDAIRQFRDALKPDPSMRGHFFILWNVVSSGGR